MVNVLTFNILAPGAAPVKVRAHPTSSQSIKVSWKVSIV